MWRQLCFLSPRSPKRCAGLHPKEAEVLPGGLQAPQEETSLCVPTSVLSRTPKGRVYKTVHTNAAPQGPCTGTGTHVKALGSRPLLAPLLYENPGWGEGRTPWLQQELLPLQRHERSGQRSPGLEGLVHGVSDCASSPIKFNSLRPCHLLQRNLVQSALWPFNLLNPEGTSG